MRLSLFTAAHLAGYKHIYPCLFPPSVSASAQPAPLAPPKRSTSSPSRLTPLQRRQSTSGQRRRGEPSRTNRSRQRGNLLQVGRLHIRSCPAKVQSMLRKKKKRNNKMSFYCSQRRCLFVDYVPPLGTMGRRRKSLGRSNWMPNRSSWRRRCRRPGGWCSGCR